MNRNYGNIEINIETKDNEDQQMIKKRTVL